MIFTFLRATGRTRYRKLFFYFSVITRFEISVLDQWCELQQWWRRMAREAATFPPPATGVWPATDPRFSAEEGRLTI